MPKSLTIHVTLPECGKVNVSKQNIGFTQMEVLGILEYVKSIQIDEIQNKAIDNE